MATVKTQMVEQYEAALQATQTQFLTDMSSANAEKEQALQSLQAKMAGRRGAGLNVCYLEL